MLVIRRRMGETLCIGGEIEVEVLAVTGSQVKLGIRAPREVPVVRREIRVVGEENQRAARPVAAPDLGRLLDALKNPAPKPIRAV
jgi:carbon storage regulator